MPELEDIFGGTPTEADPPTEPVTESASPPQQPPTPPAAPAADPQEPSQPSFASSGLYARAQAAGLPLDGISDESSFAEAMLDRYMQDLPYTQHGRASFTQPKRVDGEKPGPHGDVEDDVEGQEFDPDSHFGSLWQAPQINEQAKFFINHGIVELGENGLYQAKAGYEAVALPVLSELNQAHVAQREQMQKLFEGNFYQNVDKGLWPALEHRFQKMLDERLQSQFQSYDQQTQATSFEKQFTEQHKAWLYQPDGRLTADGEKFRQTVQELRDQGITDHQKLAAYALKLSGVNTAPIQTVPAPPADAGRQRDGQGKFVKGTEAPPAATARTKQESFIDEMRRKANASSSQGSYTDAAGEFVPSNEGDLENMFTNAYRKHKTGAAA